MQTRKLFKRRVCVAFGIGTIVLILLCLFTPVFRIDGTEIWSEDVLVDGSFLTVDEVLHGMLRFAVDNNMRVPPPTKRPTNPPPISTRIIDANTPESFFDTYYSSQPSEIATRNVDVEKELFSDSFAVNTQRSDHFLDLSHTIRRGYGLEGSIFVALSTADILPRFFQSPIQALSSRWTGSDGSRAMHVTDAICSSTVRSIFKNAKWPQGVFVGMLEFVFGVSGKDGGKIDKIVSCAPNDFYNSTDNERLGFSIMDNIRTRAVRIPVGKEWPLQFGTRTVQNYSTTIAHYVSVLQLYRGETYVMFVRSGVFLARNWDWIFRVLHIKLAESGPTLISTKAHDATELIRNVLHKEQEKYAVAQSGKVHIPCTNNSSEGGCMKTASKNNRDRSIADAIGVAFSEGSEAYFGAETQLDVVKNDCGHCEEVQCPTLCWLRNKRDEVRQKLLDTMYQIRSVTLLEVKPLDGPNGISTPPYALYPRVVSAQTDILQDKSFLLPGWEGFSFMAADADGANAKKNKAYLQRAVSCDLIFGPSEAFVEVLKDDRLRSSGKGTRMELDPYITHLSVDEMDSYLTAHLWTNGWNVFTPLQPTAFHIQSFSKSVSDAHSPSSSELFFRDISLRRLGCVYSNCTCQRGSPLPNNTCSSEVYGLGIQRRLSDIVM